MITCFFLTHTLIHYVGDNISLEKLEKLVVTLRCSSLFTIVVVEDAVVFAVLIV